MKTRLLFGSLVGVVMLAMLAACGSGDESDAGSQSGIRTQKGLAVAALAQNLGPTGTNGSVAGGRGAAPAADTSAGSGQAPENAYSRVVGEPVGGYPSGPLQQSGTNGLTVQGYGTASADADSAAADFYFSRNSLVKPVPFPESGIPSQEPVAQITEAALQPVIDALTAAGVSRDDIKFTGQTYYNQFSSDVSLHVTIKNISSLDATIQAASSASASLSDITFNTSVAYTVNDCAALEVQAMKAAVEDTGERAANFANALGVHIGAIIGAANYSYFGGPTCNSAFGGAYPVGAKLGYFTGQSKQVQVFANISVTYAIQ